MSPTEVSPLLGSDCQDQPTCETPGERMSTALIAKIGLYLIFVFFVDGGMTLFGIPLPQIYEDILCRSQQQNPMLITGLNCGDNKVVQEELAYLRGWQGTFRLIPGLLLAVPMGLLADKRGHKVVVILCVLGSWLRMLAEIAICWWTDIFPVRLIWAANVFELIGGGGPVLGAMVFASLSNITPTTYRSTVFSYLVVCSTAVKIISNSLASYLMSLNLWIPILGGLTAQTCAAVISTLLATVDSSRPADGPEAHQVRNSTSGNDNLSLLQKMKHRGRHGWVTLRKWRHQEDGKRERKAMAPLLLTLLLTTLGWHAQDMFMQYARVKYGWSWSMRGYIGTLEEISGLILLSIVLPLLVYVLTTRVGLSSLRTDLFLARSSCAIMIAGSVVTGLSTSPGMMIAGHVLETFSTGYNLVLRTLLAALAGESYSGLIFNIVAILETLGSLIAGPLLALAFRIAIGLGNEWLGLHFLLAAGLLTIAFGTLQFVKI